MNILITGGAGFVGSYLAEAYRDKYPHSRVVAFDNLRRRGSELNLSRFKKLGIEFVHGDVRQSQDLSDLHSEFDLMIEASAEPSVQAGISGSPGYVLQTNLVGTLNCLEFARKHVGALLFLSTSRVYSIESLKGIPLRENQTRFELDLPATSVTQGLSAQGVSEGFPVHLPRSFYGATKLASEMMIQEYVDTYQMSAMINRCGVIAGPGQFGKVDQGVFTLWVAAHTLGRPLKYTGFGGTGKQVRDLLHPADLFKALEWQFSRMSQGSVPVYNLGGGCEGSTSLMELTHLCEEVTGRSVAMECVPNTLRVDIPYYVSDCGLFQSRSNWKPEKSVRNIVKDIHAWIAKNEAVLKDLF